MAKYPKSLTEAIKHIKSLQNELVQSNADRDGFASDAAGFRREKLAAEAREKEARDQFSELKERLHSSEIENARLRGYMERVREDDAVADPVIEVEGPEGKRFVSKRHPTPLMNNYGADQYLHEMSREKRKHWTSY